MKLKATMLVALGLSVIAAPQALAATPGPVTKAAAHACNAERAQLGKQIFRATYGRPAMVKCMRATRDEAQEAVRNAAQACRAERAADPEAFRTTYGSNENGRNAFGRCVSQKARAEMRPEIRATVNAAKACKAERAADAEAFRTKYGTNENGRNAFGKCVSQTKTAEEEEEAAA